ncbi:MAG: hypothetical protein GXO47_08825 [Chlorobi bacterium]|nr:hypothetical protein [Chlorobiota bacterium]
MRSLIFIILTSVLFVACEQQETTIVPTFKESVEFIVIEPEFSIEESIPAENIQIIAGKINATDDVHIDDVWLEINTLEGNYSNIATVNLSLAGRNSENIELVKNIILNLEENKTVVPLISVLTSEGYQELEAQINDIINGSNNENIKFSLEGDSYFKDGLNGNVNIEIEMFIRYSF